MSSSSYLPTAAPRAAGANEQKRLSIIVPTYNRHEQLVRAADLLIRQIVNQSLAGSVEVLIVDDGSDPPVAAQLRAFVSDRAMPFLHYLRLGENRGASAARNAGAQASRAALVAFLDDDIVPADDYVAAVIQAHEQHPEALVINGNLRPLHNNVYSGFWFHYYNAVFNRPGEQFYSVPMLGCGHVSMKRQLLEVENPLFDTSLTSREDYDLFLRLEEKGITVFKDDRILAFNDCRHSLYRFIKQRIWYGRGQEQLVAKHGAAFLAAKQQRYFVAPNQKYALLYIALRVARRIHRLYHTTRRLVDRTRGLKPLPRG